MPDHLFISLWSLPSFPRTLWSLVYSFMQKDVSIWKYIGVAEKNLETDLSQIILHFSVCSWVIGYWTAWLWVYRWDEETNMDQKLKTLSAECHLWDPSCEMSEPTISGSRNDAYLVSFCSQKCWSQKNEAFDLRLDFSVCICVMGRVRPGNVVRPHKAPSFSLTPLVFL